MVSSVERAEAGASERVSEWASGRVGEWVGSSGPGRTLTTSFISETGSNPFSGQGNENSGATNPSSRKSVSTRAWTTTFLLQFWTIEAAGAFPASVDRRIVARCMMMMMLMKPN